jgi:hypothetical protein
MMCPFSAFDVRLLFGRSKGCELTVQVDSRTLARFSFLSLPGWRHGSESPVSFGDSAAISFLIEHPMLATTHPRAAQSGI